HEAGGRRLLPGQREHRLRDIDTEYLVACAKQLPRPDAAAAAEIDHQPVRDSAFSQHPENGWGSSRGEIAEADIVDVRQILVIGRHHVHFLAARAGWGLAKSARAPPVAGVEINWFLPCGSPLSNIVWIGRERVTTSQEPSFSCVLSRNWTPR